LDSGSNPESRTSNPEDQPTAGASAIRPAGPGPFDQVTELVVNSVHSEHSRRAYRRALEDFIAWYQDRPGRPPLSKALVQQYRVALTEAKLAPSTINVHLSTIRKLAAEAADNRLLDADLAAGIAKVRGVKNGGVRAGNWLTREQARDLLLAPDTSTLKGKRDRAILAVLLGCGLRSSLRSRSARSSSARTAG
jgi:site-specific recombinase XerD